MLAEKKTLKTDPLETKRRESFLKESLRHLAYGNPIYNLSLKTRRVLSLNYVPNDIWPGHSDEGMKLVNNEYHFAGQTIKSGLVPWASDQVSDAFLTELHSFEWLRDLRTLGGDVARRKARAMIEDWIRDYSQWTPFVWSPAILVKRISAWISFYHFAIASADEDLRDRFMTSLAAQSKHLLRLYPAGLEGVERLIALKALLAIHICLPLSSVSEEKIQHLIEQEASAQIWKDGMHISRNPSHHMRSLMILIDIRTLLQGADVTPPNSLNTIITRMAAALKFMRHGDGKLALFSGGHEEEELLIDSILSASAYKGKPAQSLKMSGYSKVTMGRSTLFMDIGPEGPAIADWKTPGSIEFSSGKQRIIVNCGTTAYPSRYSDHMKRTVASSTLSVDEDCVDFLAYKEFDIEPRRFVMHEHYDHCLIELSHAGFYAAKDTIHHRRLYVGSDGVDIRGEDILTGPAGKFYTLRFHLHPSVKTSLIQDGYELFLSPPKGDSFRFIAGGHPIKIEESIYFENGQTPRKAQQIVFEGQTISGETAIQWALQKE